VPGYGDRVTIDAGPNRRDDAKPGGRPEQAEREAAERDEEADRRLGELLQELRVALPGATVLFGFLLAVSVSARFDDFSRSNRTTYLVAFGASALALVFLLAEAGYHRIRGHPYNKEVMIRTASRQAIAALVMLGVALVASSALVVELMHGETAALVVAVGLGVLIVTLWFGLPLVRRLRDR
jgi:hypothetical protein